MARRSARPEKPPRAARGASRRPRRRWLLPVLLGGAALIGVVCLSAVRMPSTSMEDSLLLGDYLVVERVSYGAAVPLLGWRLPGLSRPRPGDVVVFQHPSDPTRCLVKRCVAVAGQTVEIRDKAVYVDGQRLPDPRLSKYADDRIRPPGPDPRDNLAPRRVPPDALFVLGDNRDNSRDSRHWGALPLVRVVGRAAWVFMSWAPATGRDPGASGVPSWWARLAGAPGRVRWQRLGASVP